MVYSILDYGLMLLSIGLVAVARSVEARFTSATAAMFVFDLVAAGLLWGICIRSAQDFTLGRDYRRTTALLQALFWTAVYWTGYDTFMN